MTAPSGAVTASEWVDNAANAMGVEAAEWREPDSTERESTSKTSSSTTKAESGDDGGCMKIFKMIIQIVAAVVSVAFPAAAPVAMAVAGAVSKMDTGEDKPGNNSGFNQSNVNSYNNSAASNMNWGGGVQTDVITRPDNSAYA